MLQYADQSTKGKTISHNMTKLILEDHGLSMTMNTEANKGILVMNTNFYSCFGIKETYNYNDLMDWLGY